MQLRLQSVRRQLLSVNKLLAVLASWDLAGLTKVQLVPGWSLDVLSADKLVARV